MSSYKTPNNLQKHQLLGSGKSHHLPLYINHSKETEEENMKGILFLELELPRDVFDSQAWQMLIMTLLGTFTKIWSLPSGYLTYSFPPFFNYTVSPSPLFVEVYIHSFLWRSTAPSHNVLEKATK